MKANKKAFMMKKSYIGKFSSVIKGVQSSISSSKIQALKVLGGDMDVIKKKIEKETTTYLLKQGYDDNPKSLDHWKWEHAWKRQCGRKIGVFCEYVVALGFLLKVPYFTSKYGSNYKCYEWDKKNKEAGKEFKSILDVSGGNSKGGEIDHLLVDQISDKVWCFSSKFRKIYDKNIRWGDTEVDRMRVAESRFTNSFNLSKSWDFKYGVFVNDKSDFKNNCKKYQKTIIHDWEDIKQIWKQVCKILNDNNFDAILINKITHLNKKHFVPWFHQEEAAEAAIKHFKSGGDLKFLLDHLCRSGKTLMALYICKLMNFKNVILLTNVPSINGQWEDAINDYYDFDYWNVVNFSGKKGKIEDGKNNFVIISLQDFKSNDRGNVKYGWDKAKFKEIKNMNCDAIVTDENHIAFETDKSEDIIKKISYTYRLALSGTPFINYAMGSFDSSNTHRWTLSDEKERAKVDSNYAKFPVMHYLLFAPPKSMYQDYLKEYNEEDGLTFKKLFRLKDDGAFFYEKDITAYLKFLFGEKGSGWNSRNTPLGWARENGINSKGMLIFVDGIKVMKPLKKLFLQNDTVKSIFGGNVHYTHSDKNKAWELKSWLEKNAVAPFIIIVDGQCVLGTTIEEVDTVVLMEDGASPQTEIQKMYRCRTALEGKKDVLVIDFNPGRTFRIGYEYSSTEAEICKKDQIECFKNLYCNLMPLIYCTNNKMVDIEKDIHKLYQMATSQYYDFFGKASLIKDLPEDMVNLLSSVLLSDGETCIKKEKYTEGIEKGKTFKGKSTGKKTNICSKDESSQSDKEVREKTAKQKLIAILQSICWASVLSGCQFNRYEDVFEYIEKNANLKREYDRLLFD